MEYNRTTARWVQRALRKLCIGELVAGTKRHDRYFNIARFHARRSRKDPDYYDAKWTKSKPSRLPRYLRDEHLTVTSSKNETSVCKQGPPFSSQSDTPPPPCFCCSPLQQTPPPRTLARTEKTRAASLGPRTNHNPAVPHAITPDAPPSSSTPPPQSSTPDWESRLPPTHPLPRTALPPHLIPLPKQTAEELVSLAGLDIESVIDSYDQIMENLRRLDDSDEKLWEKLDHLRQSDKILAIHTALHSDGWTSSVNAMRAARELKERLIRVKPLPEERLDELDLLEVRACSALYGGFLYQMRLAHEPELVTFSKKEVDTEMENRFGSLDRVGDGLTRNEARQLFSRYLARKVWVPSSWKDLKKAVEQFVKRTVLNEIEKPMDNKAFAIASKVLDAIVTGMDPEPFKRAPYTPDSACIERGFKGGGKRFSKFIALDKQGGTYVIPCAIYTGGKIRVITIDSVVNCDLAWINKYLGACFRRLPCSVFGGKVEEWFARIGGLVPQEGEDYISGDLEAATDNFDGRITRRLLLQFGQKFGLSEDQLARAIQITTNARFKIGKEFLKQTRGQLMGSVLSFPFLCILSLTAYLFTKSSNWIGKFTHAAPREALKMLMRIRDVGVNGDDVAFTGNATKVQKWTLGVESIGGVISRGKTLKSPKFFTINSELWDREGKINCLRPSLLTALTGDNKYFINPAIEWKEFRRCTLRTAESEEVWNLVPKLGLDLPVSLGGLGLEVRRNLDLDFLARATKGYERSCQSRMEKKVRFSTDLERDMAVKEDLAQFGRRVPMLVSKEMSRAWSKVYKCDHEQWILKPEELRAMATFVQRPDLFPDQARISLPFMQIPEKPTFKFKGSVWFYDWIIDNYYQLMNGARVKLIPEDLQNAFQGERTDFFNGVVVDEVNSEDDC